MEILFLSYLLTGFVFLLFLVLQIWFYRNRSLLSSTNLPPGTTGWPFFGETLEFLSTGWKGKPETFIFDRMIKYTSDCFKTSLLGENMVVLCGQGGNKFLFTNENKFVTGWWPDSVSKVFPSALETSSYEESKKMRKLLSQFLKPEALQRYISVMDTVAQQHFTTEWENKEDVFVVALAKSYTFQLASRLFINMDDPANNIPGFAAQFNHVTAGIMSLPLDFPGTPFNKAIKAAKFIRNELTKVAKQRKIDLAENKATSKQDILSHMLTVTDEDGQFMNELDIADKIMGLLIGGHDTVSTVISLIVKYLAELPHVYDAVYKEQMSIANDKHPGELLKWVDIQNMKYSWNVASEVMRLAPPFYGGFREALTDFTYAGFKIPKGWKLYWTTHATHLDARYFPEPETFDPTRFEGIGPAPYTYIPFGGGPRMCPGKEFARLVILVFMHNIVRRFKWEKLLPGEKIIVNPLPVPEKMLPIHLIPHKMEL